MPKCDPQPMVGLLKTISNPIRLKILCLLLDGEKSVSQIHDHFHSSYANISQHMRSMQSQGLISAEKRANFMYNFITDQRAVQLVALLRKLYCPNEKTNQGETP